MYRLLLLFVVVMAVGIFAAPVPAVLVGDQAVVYGWQSAGAGSDGMRGWVFSTNSEVEVTALGVFDHENPDGLQGEHEVVIWDSEGDIVISATVPAATAAQRIGSTRYVEVTPTILPASQTFLIASQHVGAGNQDWFAHTYFSINFNPAITFIEGRLLSTSDLVPPTDVFARPLIGPNFLMNVVPEPASVALLLTALPWVLRRKHALKMN